jgi:hypothetical protein
MSVGEAVDKLIIIEIKRQKLILDSDIREMLDSQAAMMRDGLTAELQRLENEKEITLRFVKLYRLLHKCNFRQWDWEDGVIGADTYEAAGRCAYRSRCYNTRRARFKREIDKLFNSRFVEVKEYATAQEKK